jgi:hypothetical protein
MGWKLLKPSAIKGIFLGRPSGSIALNLEHLAVSACFLPVLACFGLKYYFNQLADSSEFAKK